MKLKKIDEGTCQECGRKPNDDNPMYEIDLGSVHIKCFDLCKKCMNRLWCNIDLLIDED